MIQQESAATINAPSAAASWDAIKIEAEAWALEMWHGPNLYSSFLRKHGTLPNRAMAAAIGKVMRTRVLASDGSRQPQR